MMFRSSLLKFHKIKMLSKGVIVANKLFLYINMNTSHKAHFQSNTLSLIIRISGDEIQSNVKQQKI